MAYTVFLVEDEIVTREGIRDTVDWGAAGYRLCGEAPDGEIALPLIRERRPDVLITDIKMPFMDGLQLCRIIRETLPATRIIILSGHDEFRYAQEAIQLGVTEYLLKPIAPRDLLAALRKVAAQLDEERQTSAHLLELQAQMATNRSRLRERCLLDLVAGTIAPAEFITRAQQLGIDLLAPCYQVMLVRAVPRAGPPETPLYHVYQQVDGIIADSIGDEAVAFKQGLEETVLILRGAAPEPLQRRAAQLSEALRQQIAERTPCRAAIGAGYATERLGSIPQSFAQALAQLGPGEPPARAADAPVPSGDAFGISAADAQRLPEPSHSAALIARARGYIDIHYGDPEISLGHVAAQVLLSPTYFSVVFSREVGETFIEYLTKVRIRKAIELLRATSLTASEIGYRVGYQNPRYFSAVFRKATGLPPNEFRRQGAPSDP